MTTICPRKRKRASHAGDMRGDMRRQRRQRSHAAGDMRRPSHINDAAPGFESIFTSMALELHAIGVTLNEEIASDIHTTTR